MRHNILLLTVIILFISCEDNTDQDVEEYALLPTTLPESFITPSDYVTGNPLLGWGGGHGEIDNTPIVFIHGNAHSADNWITMATYFAEEGYSWNELWAMSYLQVVNDENYNSNEGNWQEIDEFVQAVIDYTGEEKVNIIAHSLGVTLARTWLRHTEDYAQVNTFIGIAGANHGVSFCGPDDHRGMCAELGHPDSDFLQWLNGTDETPNDNEIQWITVYNGANLDLFFPQNALMNDNTTHDLRTSPVLDGAINIQYPDMDHMRLALSKTVYDTLKNYINSTN